MNKKNLPASVAEEKQNDPEALRKEIAELKSEIRQIKEVLNSIIGLLSEEDIADDDDSSAPFAPRSGDMIDPNMLN